MEPLSSFFTLLRAGMTAKPIPADQLPDHIDWERVVALARKHTVLGIVIDAIQYLPAELRPAPALAARLQKFALGLIQANILTDRAVGHLVSFFDSHGIHGVLLKGQGIARLYREPHMRQNGDIDFFVGAEQYPKARDLVRRHLLRPDDRPEENTQHFGFMLDGVPVELHRLATISYNPMVNPRLQRWITDQLLHSPRRRTLSIGGADVTVPSLEFDTVYIFYHAWRHYLTGGVGLRQLCDWAMILLTHGDRLDKARIAADIRRFHMTRGWRLFACIAVKYLGVPPETMPLYDPKYEKASRKVFEEIMAGGNFGRDLEVSPVFDTQGSGVRYELGKIPALTQYCLSLFPLIPAEATFLYFHRLFSGFSAFIKKLHR